MKHKKFLLIALICLIGIGISFLLFSAHRPFKDLEAADITSASVRLSPPDTTIQIVETEELVSYLNEVVIYNKDNSYTEYAGQAVIFTLSLADGSQVEIIAYNPFIIIDGIGYKCKYEPCEALNHYEDGTLTINFSEMSATLSGKPLTFTPLEYRLLKILIKNPQIVLTRQVLLEKLWDADGNFVDEHALTAAISRVRNKIETPDRQYIKTVYGMGYMWIGGALK